MAKWKPRHPAKQIVTTTRCEIGQRYATRDRARAALGGGLSGLTASLRLAICSQCGGGYHTVTQDELSYHRNVLTEVSRYG